MIGLSSAVHWAAWFIHTFITLTLIMSILTCALFFNISDTGFSSFTVFFVFALEYSASVVSFSCCFSVFFKHSSFAASFCCILIFISVIANFYVTSIYTTLAPMSKWFWCLNYNQAFYIGTRIFVHYQAQGDRATWDKVFTPPLGDDFTLGNCMLMLLVDTFLFFFFTWFISNMCFKTSYCCGNREEVQEEEMVVGADVAERYFAPKPILPVGIKISKLKKDFGDIRAVNIADLELYEGEIFVLLGHNGAGKTTTISMLTGLLTPSSGTAYLNGLDIRYNSKEVQRNLGFCPQFSVYFDVLTVEEHLLYFAKLQGNDSDDLDDDVTEMIHKVGLTEKKEAPAKTLAGGQKRRLSVAIAFINQPRIVILDEPSTGMDPAARRHMWKMLRKLKKGRTILMTTHFMDEADALGDRIAIMAKSMIICCGPPLFLKTLYGVGPRLIIERSEDCDVDMVTEFIKDCLPSATLTSYEKVEVTYILPNNEAARIPRLLRHLEENKEQLGIIDYGTSAITMEEVYMSVDKQVHDAIDTIEQIPAIADAEEMFKGNVEDVYKEPPDTTSDTTDASKEPPTSEDIATEDTATGISFMAFDFSQNATEGGGMVCPQYEKLGCLALIWSRLYGLLLKRCIVFARSSDLVLIQLVLPPVFFVVYSAVDFHEVSSVRYLDLNLEGYTEGSTVVYSLAPSDDADLVDLAIIYKSQFSGKHQAMEKTNVTQFLGEEAQRLGYLKFGHRYLIGAKFCKDDNGTITAIALFNRFPYHTKAISLNYIINGLAVHFSAGKRQLQGGISTSDDVFNDIEDDHTPFSARTFLASTLFVLNIVCANFLVFLIKERTSGSKHLQLLSGATPLLYWVTNFIFDFFVFLVANLLIAAVVIIYDVEPLSDFHCFEAFVMILILFCWASIPFMFCMAAFFMEPASGMVAGFAINYIAIIVTVIIVYAWDPTNIEDNFFNNLFSTIFPNHATAMAVFTIFDNYLKNQVCHLDKDYKSSCLISEGECCKNYGKGCSISQKEHSCYEVSDDYLRYEEGIGKYLMLQGVQGIVYFSIRVFWDYRFLKRLQQTFWYYKKVHHGSEYDDDVTFERKRIESSQGAQEDVLLLVNLYKLYGKMVAVDGISLGIQEGECFGLLGLNGAGKTTTFKMIVGTETISGGDVYCSGASLRKQVTEYHSNMGYCPQTDCLIDQMTGAEMLYMYGRLRGLPVNKIKACMNLLVERLDFKRHVDKLTVNLSGGNQRKLSTAIALIGDPPVILLDEPSAGMDPGARFRMWSALSDVRATGTTLVLSSHSMEECEALCTRITIMREGRMVCLGSLQHIKSKFAQGYTLQVRMGTDEEGVEAAVQPVIDRIQDKLQSAYVFNSEEGFTHMQVPDRKVHVADVFEVLEDCKHDLNLEDYSVQQTSLEQVFLKLTKDAS